MDDIGANIRSVRERIETAATQAGRRVDDIKLIAVSKTHPPEAIAVALRAGQHAFGESTAQEALGKIPAFHAREIEWHFIGHLQSNKARFVPGNFHWLHSLDSLKLAQRLSRMAAEQDAHLNVLIEVNVTGDPAKHGVAADDLPLLLDQLLKAELPSLALRGLMTVGPVTTHESELRAAFAALRELRDRCALPGFTELSMGMSGDFEAAIKEGASMVRIGSAIFGARDYA